MTLTYAQANDEMNKVFKDAWDGTGYSAFYQDVKDARDTSENPWACIFIKHVRSSLSTLSGVVGTRTFTRYGLITIQIFTKIGNGLQESYTLAKTLSDSFEGNTTPGGVRFRDVRLNEVGRDGQFFQLNVVIEFEYDEIK